MQRTTRRISRRVLIVDPEIERSGSSSAQRVRAFEEELRARDIEAVEAYSFEDGLAVGVSDAGLDCILVNWTACTSDENALASGTELLRTIRQRNAKIPIFLMASRRRVGAVSVEVATLADEYIWIH